MAPEDSNPILCSITDENYPSLIERFFSKDVWNSPPKAICVFFAFLIGYTRFPFCCENKMAQIESICYLVHGRHLHGRFSGLKQMDDRNNRYI
ncbi:hypothetical protein CEXT_140401 [Caerostris extrusa]|uniref:Uncharacterized protein n=1 Tax=Caerostris extrusa TaxID=172846 RepID=A0AAV4XIG2_CAEEX|nr:hypothetical protein CEXT_140401 [Caerostris extrusa]